MAKEQKPVYHVFELRNIGGRKKNGDTDKKFTLVQRTDDLITKSEIKPTIKNLRKDGKNDNKAFIALKVR